MWATRLANVADASHVMAMNQNAEATEMANFNTLYEATERFEAAERDVRIAAIRLNSLLPGNPLRYGVEATRRLRAARAELEAARVAYDAAQDLPAPED